MIESRIPRVSPAQRFGGHQGNRGFGTLAGLGRALVLSIVIMFALAGSMATWPTVAADLGSEETARREMAGVLDLNSAVGCPVAVRTLAVVFFMDSGLNTLYTYVPASGRVDAVAIRQGDCLAAVGLSTGIVAFAYPIAPPSEAPANLSFQTGITGLSWSIDGSFLAVSKASAEVDVFDSNLSYVRTFLKEIGGSVGWTGVGMGSHLLFLHGIGQLAIHTMEGEIIPITTGIVESPESQWAAFQSGAVVSLQATRAGARITYSTDEGRTVAGYLSAPRPRVSMLEALPTGTLVTWLPESEQLTLWDSMIPISEEAIPFNTLYVAWIQVRTLVVWSADFGGFLAAIELHAQASTTIGLQLDEPVEGTSVTADKLEVAGRLFPPDREGDVLLRLGLQPWVSIRAAGAFIVELDTSGLEPGPHQLMAGFFDGTEYAQWVVLNLTLASTGQAARIPITVWFSTPASGDTVTGLIGSYMSASDPGRSNNSVDVVQVSFGDGLWYQAEFLGTRWFFLLDTTKLANGPLRLYAKATSEGTESAPASLDLTVFNPVADPVLRMWIESPEPFALLTPSASLSGGYAESSSAEKTLQYSVAGGPWQTPPNATVQSGRWEVPFDGAESPWRTFVICARLVSGSQVTQPACRPFSAIVDPRNADEVPSVVIANVSARAESQTTVSFAVHGTSIGSRPIQRVFVQVDGFGWTEANGDESWRWGTLVNSGTPRVFQIQARAYDGYRLSEVTTWEVLVPSVEDGQRANPLLPSAEFPILVILFIVIGAFAVAQFLAPWLKRRQDDE